MRYDTFKYLFPPRPEHKTTPEELGKFDRGEYYAMPKYNGSACMVFTDGKELHIYNRHKELLSNVSKEIEFKKLAKTAGEWYVYAGEYLNKAKAGEHGNIERDKYVIWDVLVWQGEYLIGQTLEQRLTLLEEIYPCKRSVISSKGIEMYEHLCCTEFKGIYKAPVYLNSFKNLYDELTPIPLYEGIVLKKKGSKLSFGYNEANNTDWQIKVRKETKNYKF